LCTPGNTLNFNSLHTYEVDLNFSFEKQILQLSHSQSQRSEMQPSLSATETGSTQQNQSKLCTTEEDQGVLRQSKGNGETETLAVPKPYAAR
jgi:hypothetical protein